MALTAAQQARIRQVLGYPDLFRYKNTRLEGILTGHQLSLETEALIVSCLASLDLVDAQTTGTSLEVAGLKRIDDVEFYPGGAAITDAYRVGRTFISRISISLGVPIYSDYYSGKGYLGDSYSASGFGNPGGKGMIPLG